MRLRVCFFSFCIAFWAPVTSSADTCLDLSQETRLTDVLNDGSFERLFPGLESEYPKLAKIVSGKIIRRIHAQNSSSWKQLETVVSSCSTAKCSIELSAHDFNFSGKVQIKEEENGEMILEIMILHFKAAMPTAEGSSKYLGYGSRPKKLNLQFVNLVGTLFSAIYRAIDLHPEIQGVRIVGNQVVNRSLATALEEIGFEGSSTRVSRMNRRTLLHGGIGLAMGYTNAMVYMFTNGHFSEKVTASAVGGVKAVGKGASFAYEVREKLNPDSETNFKVRNWVLQLSIAERQTQDAEADVL